MNYIKISSIISFNFAKPKNNIMKNIIILFLLIGSYNSSLFASDIDMFLMRKGAKVNIALIFNSGEKPSSIIIERKSTAPLSVYRRIIILSDKQMDRLFLGKKLLLGDYYPESRQLDFFYRMVIEEDEIYKRPPPIFLPRGTQLEAVTFGDHELKDETMFISEKEKNPPTLEEYGITFKVNRVKLTVLVTIGGGANLEGDWYIERKTSKKLASYRRVKTIKQEDKELVQGREHVFVDKYPESRKLDALYRLTVVTKEGEVIELPPIFLEGESARNKYWYRIKNNFKY